MDGPGAETTSPGPFIVLSWICLPLGVGPFLSHGGWLPTAVCVWGVCLLEGSVWGVQTE